MLIVAYILIALAGYLLGSIPTGYLVARAKGMDIRTVGSGNIGATNAFRVLGKPAGVFVLLTDALKGWLAVWVVAVWILNTLLPSDSSDAMRTFAAIIAGLFAVFGHNYPCWLNFKGGKGIATSAGVLVALVPWALIIILSVWIILVLTTRYVSIGSIAAAAVLPFATWFTTRHDVALTIVTGALGAMAIYKHKGNLQRLFAGTESRFNFKRKETAP